MNGYPPTPTHSTSVPPPHAPTANTGAPDLGVAAVVVVLLVLAAVLLMFLGRQFSKEES